MPVIRERNNFTIGPIGVARVSAGVSGSNAAGTVANAVSAGANQMADMFFRQGAQAAEKAGLEQGSAIAQEKVLAIDPKTGEPVAYDAPQGFGTIAQEAYQRVVLSRFQTGIEQEIKLKAQELAVKYDGSVGRYTAAMSDYIGAMTENADGQFKTYINDVGTSYLNATRSAMAMDQIRRERAGAADSLGSSIAEGTNFLEWQYTQEGERASSPTLGGAYPTISNSTEIQVKKAIDDGVTSGLISPDKGKAAYQELGMARIRGLVRYAAKSGATSDELKLMNSAIGTGNPAIVPQKYSYIADSIASLGANYAALADLEKFSSGIFDDALQAAEVIERQEADFATSQHIIAAAQIKTNATASSNAVTSIALTNPLPAVLSSIESDFVNRTSEAAFLKSNGRTDEAAAITEEATILFNAAKRGLFIRALDGASVAEASLIEGAIKSQKVNQLPQQFQDTANAILALENISAGSIDSFGSFAQDYRENTGKIITEKKQLQSFTIASSYVANAGLHMANLLPDAIDGVYESGITSFANSNLRDEDRKSLTKDLAHNAALAHLSRAFSGQTMNEDQLINVKKYLTDGQGGEMFTPAQKIELDKARQYTTISGQNSNLATKAGEFIDNVRENDKVQAEKVAKGKLAFSIMVGYADGSDAKVRTVADEIFTQGHPELNGLNAGLLISNGQLFNDPKMSTALNDLASMSVLPQSVVDAFRGATRGTLSADKVSYTLRAWQNLRYTTNETTGGEIMSPAVIASMDQKDIAKMDLLAGASSLFAESPEKIQQTMRLYDQYVGNETYRKTVEEILGEPLDVFVASLDGMDGAMPEDMAAITAATLGLIGASTVTGNSVDTIRETLTAQINRSFPADGWVLNGLGGLGSRSAPSIVLGANAPAFQGFTLDRVNLNGFMLILLILKKELCNIFPMLVGLVAIQQENLRHTASCLKLCCAQMARPHQVEHLIL
jgi:hypothetical protein